jgi:2-dehydro-3-deoxyphosphogluconate aldolase/(4S)-4-hydroxy-2-oxoglutarate aldolase|tara:strand:- start:1581 stop:2207 length:627 start_codon:yes stop_codon:yes gene_type:complete
MNILDIIKKHKIIPLGTLVTEEEVENICNCLTKADLPLIEVTLRDKKVIDVLKEFKNYSNISLGIGTIRSKDQIDLAIEAGASFAITPGFSLKLSEYALESGLTLIPGVQTASEVMAASEAGHKTLKFFPAELSGGVDRLNAFKSVFSDITFIPTGGITSKNIANYLNLDNVVAAGASSAMPESLIRSKSWQEISNNLEEIKTIIKII